MAKHPNVQKKAQAELDVVVGPGKLPTYDDYVALPYIRAIFLECMRLSTVLPLGLPHRLVTDDYYNGYFIPSGTTVIPVSLNLGLDDVSFAEDRCSMLHVEIIERMVRTSPLTYNVVHVFFQAYVAQLEGLPRTTLF